MRKLLILALLFTLACSNSNTSTDTGTAPARLIQGGAGSAQPTKDEQIRGNKKSMIYHWPGCPNYDDIAPGNRVYFKSRAEAEAAGYRAARNC
jgi:deoxyribonuclease I